MHIIPNLKRPAVLLREAWREGKRVRRRTIASFSGIPPGVVDGIRAMLESGVVHGAWHMRREPARILDDWQAAQVRRKTPVEKAEVSDRVKQQPNRGRLPGS